MINKLLEDSLVIVIGLINTVKQHQIQIADNFIINQ